MALVRYLVYSNMADKNHFKFLNLSLIFKLWGKPNYYAQIRQVVNGLKKEVQERPI